MVHEARSCLVHILTPIGKYHMHTLVSTAQHSQRRGIFQPSSHSFCALQVCIYRSLHFIFAFYVALRSPSVGLRSSGLAEIHFLVICLLHHQGRCMPLCDTTRICEVVHAIDDLRLKPCLLLQVMILTLFLRVSCCNSVCVTGIPRVKVCSRVCCDIG